MPKRPGRLLHTLLLLCFLFAPAGIHAQQQISAPDESVFGSKFFDQLNSIFGKFRDSDLQRVFQLAEPIKCTELVSGKGEWHQVAFFNDNRTLGDWFHGNLEEVRRDLSVYLFNGACQADHATVQVTTKFPVGDSIDDFNAGKIPFERINVNVNAPVNAAYDTRTGAYTFELPFLYLVRRQQPSTRETNNVYSLVPQHFGEPYDKDVTNFWDCKAVAASDITYRFLICRTTMAERGVAVRNVPRTPSDKGASAYFILSDGSEAHSTVTLKFGDPDVLEPAPGPSAAAAAVPQGEIAWQAPGYRTAVVEAGMSEFRILFNPDSWMTRITSSQVVANQSIASLQSAKPQEGADYCVWTPGASDLVRRVLADEPDKDVLYSLSGLDRGAGQSTASITFLMKTLTGSRLGTLQCFFPRTDTADLVGYDRWSSIVGGQLKLEVRGNPAR